MQTLTYRKLWLAIGWALIFLVIYLSLTPNPPKPPDFEYGDKLQHFSAYATMMLWFCQIYPRNANRLWIGMALAGMGVALEYVQRMTGYRLFEYADMAANATGVLIGWALAQTRLANGLQYAELLFGARPAR